MNRVFGAESETLVVGSIDCGLEPIEFAPTPTWSPVLPDPMEADDVLPGLENVVRRHGDGLSDEGDASLRRRLDGRRRERSISPARVRDPHIDGSLRPLPQGDALRNVALGADTVLDRRIEQQVAREVPPTQTDIRSQNVNTAAVQHVAREEPPVQTDVRSQNVQSQQALDGALLEHRTDVTNLIIQLGSNPVTRAKFGALVHDIFVMWVRQCHPAMKNANEQDCLARAWDCMHFGLFDPHLEHLAKKSSESISRSNDVVVAAFPVRRGMILDDELQSLVQTVPSEKEKIHLQYAASCPPFVVRRTCVFLCADHSLVDGPDNLSLNDVLVRGGDVVAFLYNWLQPGPDVG